MTTIRVGYALAVLSPILAVISFLIIGSDVLARGPAAVVIFLINTSLAVWAQGQRRRLTEGGVLRLTPLQNLAFGLFPFYILLYLLVTEDIAGSLIGATLAMIYSLFVIYLARRPLIIPPDDRARS